MNSILDAPSITVQLKRRLIHVKFPFNRELVKLIRTVPEAEWDPKGKVWKFPLALEVIQLLLTVLVPLPNKEIDPKIHDWIAFEQARVAEIDAVLAKTDHELKYERGDDLMPFQRRSVDFLTTAMAAILGDDMGLGKTVQTIATIREMELRDKFPGNNRRYLVICPHQMRGTWEEHVHDWYTGPVTNVSIVGSGAGLTRDAPDGWYIINWDKVSPRLSRLSQIFWEAVIVDESHRMKNRDARRSAAVNKLKGRRRLLLSGTPVRKSPGDLWNQLHFANPGRYSSFYRFFNRHVETEEDLFGHQVVVGIKDEAALQHELRTIMIARKDGDEGVNLGIPPLLPTIRIAVTLEGKQLQTYQTMRDELVAWINGEQDSDDPDLVARNWLTQSLRLKQISGALGTVDPGNDESAKIDALGSLIDEVWEHDPSEKFVVMSQFTTMTDVVERRLQRDGISYCLFTGKKSGIFNADVDKFEAMSRDDVRRTFQSSDVPYIFLATIGAGGEGITLTAARRFVFLDLSWTPGENLQAIKRIHRKGQTRECYCYEILARNTIDYSAILPSLRRKSDIIAEVMGRSEA